MADVRLHQTPDGGEITVTNGTFARDDGLDTAAFLSLFGGNDDDPGVDPGDRRQWWGNASENESSRQYRSETAHLLRSLPLVPANLRRIEDSAFRDLSWFVDDGFAEFVGASASLPALNRVHLDVSIEVDGTLIQIPFVATSDPQ